ncbi:hypothetical protein KF728_09560 [Candidatus Obscuribacterales bacterium]|nr:hypothetical protein [Candidatus Obscuribacterales bacterium]
MQNAITLSLLTGAATWVSTGTLIWCAGDLTPQAHALSNAIATPVALAVTAFSFIKIKNYLRKKLNSVRYQRRLHRYEVDEVSNAIQRTMTAAHYGAVQWYPRVIDLVSGYFSFALTAPDAFPFAPELRNANSQNLLILEVFIDYDIDSDSTRTTLVFGGNAFASVMESSRFQMHAKQILARIDSELPAHEVVEVSQEEIDYMEMRSVAK